MLETSTKVEIKGRKGIRLICRRWRSMLDPEIQNSKVFRFKTFLKLFEVSL